MPLTGVRFESAASGHARHRACRCLEALRDPEPLVRRDAATLQIESDNQQRIAIETEIDCRERRKRPQKKAGADDQHERQRHLQHDKRLTQHPRPLAGDGAPLLLHRLDRLDASGAKCRHDAKQQRRRDRHGGGEPEHAPVEREIERYGFLVRGELLHQESAAPPRQHQPKRRSGAGQDQALGEQLARDPELRRAHRQPKAQLVAPGIRAGQHQVGDVGAGNQQHEADRHHDDDERLTVAILQLRGARGGARERERVAEILLEHVGRPVGQASPDESAAARH